MKINIAIIAGGDGFEHEVSLKSGNGVFNFLDKEKYNPFLVIIHNARWQVKISSDIWCEIDKNDFSFTHNGQKTKFDFAYIIIHGTPGENGLLQGYLSLLNIPHSTCNVLCSALTFNKFKCNTYLKTFGINTAKSIIVKKGSLIDDKTILDSVGLPCFIKCTEGGSSLGCFKTKTQADIKKNVEQAFKYGNEVVCESFIDGKEFSCGIYKTKTKTVIFPITEVISHNEFFDYDAKYNNQVDEITPARISDELTQQINNITLHVYDILDCKGIVRVDYIVDKNETIFLLEVNTVPGMTPTSFIPQQVQSAGLNISTVLDEIIEDAMN